MQELTSEERVVFEKNIENQIWFDYVKEMYPNMIRKIAKVIDLGPNEETVLESMNLIRYIDFERKVGEQTIKDIKLFSGMDENIGALDTSSLSDEELLKLNRVISMFPYQITASDEKFSLTDLLITILEELKTKGKSL